MAHHQVGVITPTQKDELTGHEWQPRSYFNPIQDCYNEWVISQEEIEGNINPDFPWVNQLPLIDYCAGTSGSSGSSGTSGGI
jgi:hypothetical protein